MGANTYFDETPRKSFFEKLGGYFVEFIETLVVFGAIFASIYLFVAQFHKVSGSSMVPTMRNGDYLITEKVTYKIRDPKDGEIIVLKNPRNESQDFIKRIIAVPGEIVEISNNTVYINGKAIEEKYLPSGVLTRPGSFLTEGNPVKVSSNQYFVFGDNRDNSSDSREWGPVTKEEIVGRALFRYYPFSGVGPLINK